jgi:hypothetical protein
MFVEPIKEMFFRLLHCISGESESILAQSSKLREVNA